MEAINGDFVANSEVDEIKWLSRRRALDVLSYEPDRALLQSTLSAT